MNTLSIIIPTLNEAQYLEATIQAIKNRCVGDSKKEVIVVDAGSIDGTPEIASRLGIRVLQIQGVGKGRVMALNYGAQEASGNILFFLDADSIPPRGYDAAIESVLEDKKVVGGAFDFALEGHEFGLRVVEWANRLRYHIWPRYYGDQGIFVRKEVFHKIGGYPLKHILEASQFCVNLKKEGEIALVRKPMLTSSRRFLNGGIYRVLGQDFKIWWLDLIGCSTEHLANAYWQDNVQRGRSLSKKELMSFSSK